MAAGKINLTRLSYVVYEHTSLDVFRQFAKDFGFVEELSSTPLTVFFRGYGEDPFLYVARQADKKRFVGAAFAAESAEDFDRATDLPNAKVQDLSNAPGGGSSVVITDPNGYEMIVLWNQQLRERPDHGISNLVGRPDVNGALDSDKKRKGHFTRMEPGPAMVHKIGHFGYATDNYERTVEWYTSTFNFVPTDVLYHPQIPSLDVAGFFRVDLGERYSDHHCLLIARNEHPGTQVHHSSFEVEDLDTQFMGHQWLQQRGHELVWGIGRHVHGSQVFDYWYDSSHFIIEHYADGDVVNKDSPLTRAAAGNMAVWGPPVPAVWSHGKDKANNESVAKPVAAVSG